ncbi:hypothetical protein [Paenibacillus sp. GCM10027626]|uniref:hypothetical protein n=1 Tax=Paenibacillus sp. GCM10027626 TaxID=3273411 RepID=UPI00363DCB06
MNIGQLMRGLLGDKQPADSKILELRPGQVVRGVLVQMADEDEAIMQINGVQVRAKLETPLQPGQSAILQVQPQSAGGQLVLKIADPQAAPMADEDIRLLLKSFGLPDQRAVHDLVRALQREGIVMTRALAQQLQQTIGELPDQLGKDTFVQAAVIAAKRGLPLSGATVTALQQVLSGPPLHQLVAQLTRELAAWQANGAAEAGALPASAQRGDVQAAAARLTALLAEGTALMQAVEDRRTQPSIAVNSRLAPSGDAAVPVARHSEGAQQQSQAAQTKVTMEGEGAMTRGGASAAIPGSQQAAGLPSGAVAATVPAPSSASASPFSSAEPAEAMKASPQQQPLSTEAAAGPSGSWLKGVLKWLGVDHERLLAQSLGGEKGPLEGTQQRQEQAQPAARTAPGTMASAAMQSRSEAGSSAPVIHAATPSVQTNIQLAHIVQSASSAGGAPTAGSGADSLKSALMTLISSHEAPVALRETAQQLVQQITGQQLLLVPERNSAPFTHVTMFIPLQQPGQEGMQTASVHIQTRKGRKGELDSGNCRLLFDLRMQTIGDTVADVQVVDKIVSLTIWNNFTTIDDLLQSSKSEIAGSLQQAGYQLLTLRALPLSERPAEPGDKGAVSAAAAEWSSRPYKGVDYRV